MVVILSAIPLSKDVDVSLYDRILGMVQDNWYFDDVIFDCQKKNDDVIFTWRKNSGLIRFNVATKTLINVYTCIAMSHENLGECFKSLSY